MVTKSQLFGKYCRINPLVFSFARSQGASDRLMVGKLRAVIRGQGQHPVYRGQIPDQCRTDDDPRHSVGKTMSMRTYRDARSTMVNILAVLFFLPFLILLLSQNRTIPAFEQVFQENYHETVNFELLYKLFTCRMIECIIQTSDFSCRPKWQTQAKIIQYLAPGSYKRWCGSWVWKRY